MTASSAGAWEALGEKSGGASYAAMTSRIVQHAHATGTRAGIGSITVAAPLFFEARDWTEQSRD